MTLQRYDRIGKTYTATRTPDPRIEARIHGALGDATKVLNVGAGAGSYEPKDRDVTALEPSWTMIRQRPVDAAPVVRGVAEQLPFADNSFDAAMGVLTFHHWTDQAAGLRELRRVCRGPVVLFTWTPEVGTDFWLLQDYFPAAIDLDLSEFPAEQVLKDTYHPRSMDTVMIPADCRDGFRAAYWKRPEAYLNQAVRDGTSTFARLPEKDVQHGLAKLEADLNSGQWLKKNAALLDLDEADLGYRLVVF